MRYLVPGPTPCPEVVAVSYIRLAEVPTLSSVEGEAQVEQQNTVVRFLTFAYANIMIAPSDVELSEILHLCQPIDDVCC